MGTVEQFVGFSPAPDFVDPALKTFMTQYDPAQAKAWLDEIGVKDARW